jgi:hypothetical protein
MADNTDTPNEFDQSSDAIKPSDVEICFNCGRELRPHCPMCGSYRNYALVKSRDVVTRPDGSRALLCVYRCVRCARRFNDDEWRSQCKAPPERKARDGRHTSSTSTRDVVWNPRVPPIDKSKAEQIAEEFRKKYGVE